MPYSTVWVTNTKLIFVASDIIDAKTLYSTTFFYYVYCFSITLTHSISSSNVMIMSMSFLIAIQAMADAFVRRVHAILKKL